MIEDQFFPTPPAIIDIMLSDLKITGTILDPSAGEGHILDAVANKRNHSYMHRDDKSGLYAIEIDPGRQAILRDKDYSVIDSDFLLHNGLQYFDIILMNPPFAEGAKHLLKAWNDVANGAIIRCLLNSETLNNPYTEERKRLENIIKQYGWSKDLGQVFRDAERPTDVFVSLIHLQDTRKKESFRLDFEPEKLNRRFKVEDIEDNALVSPNVFAAYEARYNASVAAFKKLLLARQEVDFFLEPLLSEYNSGQKLVGEALKSSQGADVSYEKFLREATREAWRHLFTKTKLYHVTTEGVRKELEKAQVQQGLMAFTAANMEALFNQLFLSRERIMTNCVLDAFDEITRWHKDNREYIEGWKTNNAYFAGKRFILPHMLSSYFQDNGLDFSAKRQVADIEKALCFLIGKPFESILSLTAVYDNNSYFGEKMQSEFFECKLYKKSTMHFLWLDENLRQQFNRVVALERFGFLPEKIKKGFYS